MHSSLLKGALALALLLGSYSPSGAFTHPGIPVSLVELDNIKAKIDQNVEPWKSAFTSLANDSHSQLSAVPQGPWAVIPNKAAWQSDMKIVYNCAMMWRLTGNTAYADKAMNLINAYATTVTDHNEDNLTVGDTVVWMVTGADILRGYPGWTPTMTTNVKNWFSTLFWDLSDVDVQLRSANQGALSLKTGMSIAVFCDDTARFTKTLEAYRNEACTGLRVIQSNGQVGDSGRDQGHAWGEISSYSWVAEVAWKQGVDLYGEGNNAILRATEYYSKYNLGLGASFIQAGPCYDLYFTIGGSPTMTASSDLHSRVFNHYVTRKGLSAPFTVQWINAVPSTRGEVIPWKNAGGIQPTAPAAAAAPGIITPPAATNLTSVTLGTAGIAGSASYNSGTWTVKGSGADMWGSSDNGHFAYQQLTGNGTIIARVTSQQVTHASAKAGIMMRDSLAANANAYVLYTLAGVPSIQVFQRSAEPTFTTQDQAAGVGAISPPYWLKMERNGRRFIASSSPDGVTWSSLNNQATGRDIVMGDTIYVGLCVTSHNNALLSTATFTNVTIDSTGSPLNTGTYKLVNRNSGKFLNVQGYGATSNVLEQWIDNPNLAEYWSLRMLGGGKYRMINVGTAKAMDVSGGSTGENIGLIVYPYSPTATNQQFSITPTTSGNYRITPVHSGKSVQVKGASLANSALIEQATYTGGNEQQWSFQLQ